MCAVRTGQEAGLFTKAALAQRKIAAGLTSQQAAEYVTDSYELTPDDVRDLCMQVAQ